MLCPTVQTNSMNAGNVLCAPRCTGLTYFLVLFNIEKPVTSERLRTKFATVFLSREGHKNDHSPAMLSGRAVGSKGSFTGRRSVTFERPSTKLVMINWRSRVLFATFTCDSHPPYYSEEFKQTGCKSPIC